MAGISDLSQLLARMGPVLHADPHGIVVSDRVPDAAFATVAEEEGRTVIATKAVLQAAGIDPGPEWARISLTVQSDLAAVGLTAAFARALAEKGISANVIAGVHHDHIFLPWDQRHEAMAALEGLSHV